MAVDALCQKIIMEHYRNPHGMGSIPADAPRSTRDNPACGDRFSLHLILEGETIRELMLEGQGCAVSTASCSLMVADLAGHNIHAAYERACAYLKALDGRQPITAKVWGDLAALDAVRQFKSRKTCARLAWLLFRDEYQRLFPDSNHTESPS